MVMVERVRLEGPFGGRGVRLWRAALVAALVGASFFLLSPASADGGDVVVFPFADKVGHFATFAVLGILARRAYPEQPAWGIWAALAFYGGAVELAQRDIPGRSMDVFDWLADAAGAAVVFAIRLSARIR